MQEDIKMPAGADLDLFGDELRAARFQPLHCRREIGHPQRYVVQALTALGDEASDGRIRRRGFQQLDAALADREHRDLHLFVLDGLFADDLQAYRLVKLLRRGQRLHCYPEMIDLKHHFPAFVTISSTTAYGSRLCSGTCIAYSPSCPSLSCSRSRRAMSPSRSISSRRSRQFSARFFAASPAFCWNS